MYKHSFDVGLDILINYIKCPGLITQEVNNVSFNRCYYKAHPCLPRIDYTNTMDISIKVAQSPLRCIQNLPVEYGRSYLLDMHLL